MVTATKKGVYGIETESFGSDPSQIDKVYQFKYRVVDLDDVIPSHNDNLSVNTSYPAELQPRLRDRAASKTQIDNIAKNLNPRALLQDSGFIDTGPMIIGDDLVVESGNGRVLALRKASQDFPEQYEKYKAMMATMSSHFGISKSDISEIKNPVLVRERVTAVDRAKFAAEANVGAVMAMSPYEQALQDSGQLSPNIISNLAVGEDQTIDQALRMRANDQIIKHFVGNIPSTERAYIADEKGAINQQGIDRLKLAIFAKTYTGDAGKRLARIFGESADPMVKSIENAMFASLPDMAKAEGLIETKQRESELSIAPDMAEVVDTYASLKQTGLTIKDYLAQQAMFEERLNPFQKKLLEHLDDIARKPKQVREMLRDIAGKVVDAPTKGQIGMMGIEPLTKEVMVYGIINKQRATISKPAFQVASTPAIGEELEKPDAGGLESAGRLGQGVGFRTGEDTGLAARTSVQVGLAGIGKEAAQTKMLEEFGGAPGAGGEKQTLIDLEAEKAKEKAKPLPGQIRLEEAEEGTMTTETLNGYIGFYKGKQLKERETEAFKAAEAKFAEEAVSTETISEREARRKAELTTEVTKEPWEMTKEELRKVPMDTFATPQEMELIMQPMVMSKSDLERFIIDKHKILIQQALSEGKPVPANVLKDYPDLAKSIPSEVTPVTEGVKPKQLVAKSKSRPVKKPANGKPRVVRVVKGEGYTRAQLREIHAGRSPRSIGLDNSKLHSNVIGINSPTVKPWITDPGRADISGIDTPPITGRAPRLTGGKGIRITPKRPRLK